jgi:uncharacterized protein with von Willebrand factor type A (vWA) domain
MDINKYAALQKIIEEMEEENANGKIILFMEDGEVKAVEVDRKVKLLLHISQPLV